LNGSAPKVLDSGRLRVHWLLRRGPTRVRLSRVVDGGPHLESVRGTIEGRSVGVYVHVPYCRSTCTFCPYFRQVLRDGRELEAYLELSKALTPGRVELLNTPEPPPSAVYGDPATWLLNTVSVHPLRYDYAVRVLRGSTADPEKLVEELVERGLVLKVQYAGATYLVRNFRY